MVKASSSGLSSVLPGGADTIVARASAAGPGALAVVRMSGPRAATVGRSVCPSLAVETPWMARLAACVGADGEALDDGIVLFFKGPKSYTGEDMVEVILHGSDAAVEGFIQGCEQAGARRATPGEFTRRAVANGKMDLLQAEAVDDLIHADTVWQLRLAREQVHGRLSRRVEAIRGRLVELRAEVEGSLDFVDQGVVVADDEIIEGLASCRSALCGILETATVGERIREGLRVVISGPTNSGKSTLFNRLLGNDRAITTPFPGTTRDPLEARLVIGGAPVVLVDTAGLRETDEPVEMEGVQRALAEIERADVVLVLQSITGPAADGVVGDRREAEVIRVTSKIDLVESKDRGLGGLGISCVTGEGLEALRERLLEVVIEPLRRLEGLVAINRRHGAALQAALAALDRCLEVPREVVAAELMAAGAALNEMVGDIDDDDVLDAVFGSFCVGK